MIPDKFHVRFATFSYGGNGSIASTSPDVYKWMMQQQIKMSKDPRIGQLSLSDICDTPITMTRNRTVKEAMDGGVDILVMIDSDQKPDMYLGKHENAKPFWDSCFDFFLKKYDEVPVVIAAPYCGPPPNECVYVFCWDGDESDHPNVNFRLRMYGRAEASGFSGIKEVAALPTGLIFCDMRAFKITEPKKPGDKPWFYYEYEDIYERSKASTEDVTMTRDLSLAGIAKNGKNSVFCNWDAWAGHWKQKCVGRPVNMPASCVADKMREAILGTQDSHRVVELNNDISEFTHGNPVREYEDRPARSDFSECEAVRALPQIVQT